MAEVNLLCWLAFHSKYNSICIYMCVYIYNMYIYARAIVINASSCIFLALFTDTDSCKS
jgi:hypothetical protein